MLDSQGGNWVGKLTAQLEEITYSFSGADEEVSFVEMKMMRWEPQWTTDLCGSTATEEPSF
jgi:hypothetical protein